MNVILDTETQLGGNEISPGGYSKPCSGYGNCDQVSRTCQCPINRHGSEDLFTVLLWLSWQKLLNFTATKKSAARLAGYDTLIIWMDFSSLLENQQNIIFDYWV